jgi:hypothetical protein
MSTGSTSAYVGACRKDIPYPSVSHESVPSLIDNLVTALYGTITKTVVNRRVVWNIPCDPNNTATINGIPRNAGEGLLCYIIRSLNLTTPSGFVTVDGIQTLTNKTLTAPVINSASISSPVITNASISNLVATGTLSLPAGSVTSAMIASGANITGNASTATTLQTARTIALSGDVTGTATSFNGSANISIPVTINAGSVTPADLSTGGPSWTTGGKTTFTGAVVSLAPAFSAFQGTSQILTAATWVKINLQSEDFDTDSFFDTTTSRFTPTVAGYYQINGAVTATTSIQFQIAIYKNGLVSKLGSNSTALAQTVSSVVYLNGSGDYLELYSYTGAFAGGTSTAGTSNTYLNGCLIKAV